MDDSPKMPERFDRSVGDLIRRDRNHPSIVIWGLLNEAGNNPAFHHATQMLPLVRSLDNSRMVFLNAGRYDGQTARRQRPVLQGPPLAQFQREGEPWIVLNPESRADRKRPSASPGRRTRFVCIPAQTENSASARWTAPESGSGHDKRDVHRHVHDARHDGRACASSAAARFSTAGSI